MQYCGRHVHISTQTQIMPYYLVLSHFAANIKALCKNSTRHETEQTCHSLTYAHSLRLRNRPSIHQHALTLATLFTWLLTLESTIQKEHFIKFSRTHCKYKSLPATEQLRISFFTHFEALDNLVNKVVISGLPCSLNEFT